MSSDRQPDAAAPQAPSASAAQTPAAGLTSAEVARRRARGQASAAAERTSRSFAQILRANVVTRFNLILGVLLAVIWTVGQPQDALFGIVIPAGAIIAAATFAAFALARAHGLPVVQQRTAAALVALALSLCVLVLLAIPLTWRRVLLVAAMIAGFALLFPLPAVRRLYELELPHGYVGATLLAAVIGTAALAAFWIFSGRRGRGQA